MQSNMGKQENDARLFYYRLLVWYKNKINKYLMYWLLDSNVWAESIKNQIHSTFNQFDCILIRASVLLDVI